MDFCDVLGELSDPVSERGAFWEFALTLKYDCGCMWDRCCRGEDPPDFYLWIGGQKVGLEVTTLSACQELQEGNARTCRVLKFLREALRGISSVQSERFEVLFVPASAEGIPNPRRKKDRRLLSAIVEYVGAFVQTGMDRGRVSGDQATFSVCRRRYGTPGIYVLDQAFYPAFDECDWRRQINDAVARKIADYGRRVCAPCWLLLNLKPYFFSDQDVRTFLLNGVPVDDPGRVAKFFDRVYAVTQYVPRVVGDEPPQVKRLH